MAPDAGEHVEVQMPWSGLILWDLETCAMEGLSTEVIRNKFQRLAQELGIPQPYRNLRIEAYGSAQNIKNSKSTISKRLTNGHKSSVLDDAFTAEPQMHPILKDDDIIFHSISDEKGKDPQSLVNTAIVNRLKQANSTDCPKPIILASGFVGTELYPGPVRIGWELLRQDMVVVCCRPESGSISEKFLKDRRIKAYGWPVKATRDFESLLFHLNPAHEYPQGTNQVINPVLFVAGVSAVVGPLIYSVVSFAV